ncbi:MAG TPA: sigma-70 family RNA polymerase sigma factor, partial [Acidimicrobiales bacterium]|nr:sigma-70 family RNA polymerase sigma factor [Acidimicrobiales bacterium]
RSGGAGLDGTVDLVRDRELVERCQRGDRTAFEELYHRYHRRLFHFCLRRLHEPYESEDAVQEAFTKAWRALPKFAGERRFYPWLTVIAGNVCTDILRRRTRLTPVSEVPLPLIDPDGRDVDELVLHEVDAAMAVEALGKLSDRHQRVLALREGSGWSTQQIAEYEGIAVPAMETLLWRARQALKREFAALAETGGRLGVALGLGAAAFRRFTFRSAARVGERLPVLPSSLRSPGALAASLVVAGGVVAGGVVAGTSHGSPAPVVALPATAQAGAVQPVPSSVLPSPAPPGAAVTSPTGAPPTGTSPGPAQQAANPGTSAAGAAADAAPTGLVADSRNGSTGPLAAGATVPADQLGSAVTGITNGLGGAVAGVGGAVGSAGSSLGSAVTGLVGGVGGDAGSAVSGLGPTIGSVVTGVGTILGGVVGGLGGALNGLTGGATTTGGGLPGAHGGSGADH